MKLAFRGRTRLELATVRAEIDLTVPTSAIVSRTRRRVLVVGTVFAISTVLGVQCAARGPCPALWWLAAGLAAFGLVALLLFQSQPRCVMSDLLRWTCPCCRSLHQTPFPVAWVVGAGTVIDATCGRCGRMVTIRLME